MVLIFWSVIEPFWFQKEHIFTIEKTILEIGRCNVYFLPSPFMRILILILFLQVSEDPGESVVFMSEILLSLFYTQMTVPFRYEWLNDMFREIGTLVFFIVTGYKFRPASDNPYLQVPVDSDEEDVEMDEVWVRLSPFSGFLFI